MYMMFGWKNVSKNAEKKQNQINKKNFKNIYCGYCGFGVDCFGVLCKSYVYF